MVDDVASLRRRVDVWTERSEARVRVVVDPAKCQGHTLCAMTAPDLFVLDDEDGHSRAIDGDVPVDQEAIARRAAAACPERAIVVQE
jgi:ferredoxin